jgi:hypothetical protein
LKGQKRLANAMTFEKYKKPIRREQFLAEMEQVGPWKELCALVEPYYLKSGRGRSPLGLERMLRIHFLQSSLQLQRPRSRRSVLRHGVHRTVCWDRPRQRGEFRTKGRSASSATFSRPMTLAGESSGRSTPTLNPAV